MALFTSNWVVTYRFPTAEKIKTRRHHKPITQTNSNSSFLFFSDFPISLLPLIRAFLPFSDYLNLLNTHQLDDFRSLKKELFYFNLPEELTLKYLRDDHYRNTINEKIRHRSKQLSLQLFHREKSWTKEFLFPLINGIHHLVATEDSLCGLSLSNLSGIRNLELSNFPTIKNFEGLENVQILHVEFFQNLIEANHLSNLQELTIMDCDSLVDVSALGNIPVLLISSCSRLINLSGLGLKNQELTLIELPVYEVNHLGNVPVLHIDCCQNVTDISGLTNNKTLSIIRCGDIEDYSSIKNIQFAELFPSPHRLDDFHSLIELTIGFNDEITDISCLANVKTLQEVEIDQCINIQDINCFSHVSILKINGNQVFTNISALGNVKKLSLSSCIRLTSLFGLANNDEVMIVDCIGLQSLFSSQLSTHSHVQLLSPPPHSCVMMSAHSNSHSTSSLPNALQLVHSEGSTATPPNISFSCSSNHYSDQYLPSSQHLPSFFTTSSSTSAAPTTSALMKIRFLYISNCPLIFSIPMFPTSIRIDVLHLHFFPNLVNIQGLFNCYTLVIDNCQMLSTISLQNIRHLKLLDCQEMRRIDGLQELSSIEIKGRSNFHLLDQLRQSQIHFVDEVRFMK